MSDGGSKPSAWFAPIDTVSRSDPSHEKARGTQNPLCPRPALNTTYTDPAQPWGCFSSGSSDLIRSAITGRIFRSPESQ
jgi:hypothetical protein